MDNEVLETAVAAEERADPAEPSTVPVAAAVPAAKKPAIPLEVRTETKEAEVPATAGAFEELEKRVESAEQLTKQQGSELHRYRVLELAREEAVRLGLSFEAGALTDAYALGLFGGVKAGDDGELAGMEGALTALQENRPYLLKSRAREKPAVPDIDALARGGKGNPLETTAARAAARGLMRGF